MYFSNNVAGCDVEDSLAVPECRIGDVGRDFVRNRDGAETTTTAELKTPDGTFLIVERRRVARDAQVIEAKAATIDFASSPQMMALGGLIILGVLVASYTSKYDAFVGHAHGAVAAPAVGFLALELFLARAAFRLFHDIHTFESVGAFIQSRFLRYLPAVVPSVLIGYVVIKMIGYPGAHADAAGLPANLLMLSDMLVWRTSTVLIGG